jgi:nitrogen fixation protein FixH
MKFHWGHGIATAATLFIAFISAMVYRSMQEKVEFVTDHYYDRELKYQQHIDREKNALALAMNMSVDYQPDPAHIVIRYPDDMPAAELSGDIDFYRPDNSDLDFRVAVRPDTSHEQVVPARAMKHGLWKVKVNWNRGTTPYYFEKRIFVN